MMEDMESLLIPQISMDVDDTPLNLEESLDNADEVFGNTDSDNEENIQIRLRNLMELENFDPAQTPEKLTTAELEAKEHLFSEGHPPIEYVRMHCSSCNCHLGTAPLNQDNRYIHPLLNVLVCKNCYEFYCSGDFEKDEDGSELYCRWCGQGGKVMCCSGCAYVFCQRCVRQNLGKRTLDLIIESDDWYCFACNPSQLVNLRILCVTLFDYVKQEIREVKQSGEIDRLKRDFSVCCSNKSAQQKYAMPVRRRRRAPSEDQTYHPSRDKDLFESRKCTNPLKKVLNSSGGGGCGGGANKPLPPLQKGAANVMHSPPPLIGIGGNTVNIRFQSAPRAILGAATTTTVGSIRARGFPTIQPRPPQPQLPQLLQNSINTSSNARPPLSAKPAQLPGASHTARPIISNTVSNMATALANQLANVNRGSQNFIPLNSLAPLMRAHSTNQAGGNHASTRRVTSLPTHFPPGLRNNWFNQAATITSTIVARLSTSLVDLSNEQSNATSVEQLATVHNKLQELLSSSVNSMIQVRKNLRNEFLNDLNKMRFTAVPKPPHNSAVRRATAVVVTTAQPPSRAANITNKILSDQQPVIVDDDDDVIIVNNEEDPLAITAAPSVVVDATVVVPSVNDSGGAITPGGTKPGIKIKVKTDLFEAGPSESKTNGLEISNLTQEGVKEEKVIEGDDKSSIILDDPIESVAAKDDLADVDKETYLQIQHALAESKLEALIEENSKYKVDTAEICPEELAKILTVRVVLTTHFSPLNVVVRKRRWRRRRSSSIKEERDDPPAKMSSVDFEEILHGNLINTEKPLFGEAFSSFVERNAVEDGGELVEDEGEGDGGRVGGAVDGDADMVGGLVEGTVDGEERAGNDAVSGDLEQIDNGAVEGGESGGLESSDGEIQADR